MTQGPNRYRNLLAELKRRQVFKVAAVYGGVAFVVMQAADFLVPALRLPDTVATGIALTMILGFPVALVLAWALEVTPQGVKREHQVTQEELAAIAAEPMSRRWPIALLGAAGTALLIGGVWWTLTRGPDAGDPASAAPAAASIAVLPFLNLSPDTANEYFSDGVTEEIIAVLSQLEDLQVMSRSATFRYKGQDVDPREVGRELNVSTILEGSVRRQGDDLRITAQLIDVESGFHLWSENYNRKYVDVFEVQDDVARRIAEAMQLNLTDSEVASLERRATDATDNLEAFELYSRARSEFYKYTPEGNAAAAALYEQALAIDEDYALALAGLSMSQTQNYNSGWSQDEVWLTSAEASARRALEIDPQLAEAHFALGFVHEQRREFDLMAEQMRKVLALNPNHAHAHDSQADVLYRMSGALDSALAEYEVALRLDPFLLPAHLNKALAHNYKGQFAEADRQLEEQLRQGPVPLLLNGHGETLMQQGRYREARASYEAALAAVPSLTEARVGLVRALIGLGDLAAAEHVAAELPTYATAGEYAVASEAFVLGLISLERGDLGTAIEQLSQAAAPTLRNWAGTSYKSALADAYMANGQPREAVQQLEAALSTDPYRKSLLYMLGVALEAAGEPDRAAAEYRRFLDAWRDADPDAPFVADARERLVALSTE
jgi:TolB-like protein/Tfp pilus assembly protein PilF